MRSPAVRPCGATRARLLTAPLLAISLTVLATLALSAATQPVHPRLELTPALDSYVALEDTPIEITYRLVPGDADAESLNFRVVSSSPTLLPPENIAVLGAATEGNLRFTPASNQFGGTAVNIVFSDRRGLVGSQGFRVHWTTVNDSPVIAPLPNLTWVRGMPPLALAVSVTDPDASDRVLSLRVSAATGLLEPRDDDWIYLGLNYFALQPTAAATGTFPVTVTAVDTRAGEGEATFLLTVIKPEFTTLAGDKARWPGHSGSFLDVNSDGWLDLLIRQSHPNGLGQLQFNQGGTNLANLVTTNSYLGSGHRTLAGDDNGDGQLDFIGARSLLFRSEPDGGLVFDDQARFEFGTITNSSSPNSAWLDFDGDGDLDLAWSPAAYGVTVQFLCKHGSGHEAITRPNPPVGAVLTAGDFDQDGLPDLMLLTWENSETIGTVWRNRGDWVFTATGLRLKLAMPLSFPRPLPGLPSLSFPHAGVVDYDGDGRPDLWVTQPTATAGEHLFILWRQGEERFEAVLTLPANEMRSAVVPAWGDFDGDGWLDVVLPFAGPERFWFGTTSFNVRSESYYVLRRNTGGGGFLPGRFLFSHTGLGGPGAGDFNRDGRLDLWSPANDGQVLLNRSGRPNLPPGTPGNLRAFVAGSEALLFWNAATDPNQSAALSYNLRVGSAPGANDVVASLSLPDGTRLTPEPGNTGFNTFRALRLTPRDWAGPDPARLYWSVQAVDNAFAGGLWAPEQTLEVSFPPNRPPLIAGLNAVTLAEDGVVEVPFALHDDRTAAADLRITVRSDNPDLFPDPLPTPAFVNRGLPGPERRLTLRPLPNAHGEARITLTVTDTAGLVTEQSFPVTVMPVNDRPEFVGLPTTLVAAPGEPVEHTFTVRDADHEPGELELAFNAVEPAGYSAELLQLERLANQWRLRVTPRTEDPLTVRFRLLLRDPAGTVVTSERLTVRFRDPPTVTLVPAGGDFRLRLSAAPQTLVDLEFSRDLVNWQFHSRHLVTDPAGLEVKPPAATDAPHGFYRFREVQ